MHESELKVKFRSWIDEYSKLAGVELGHIPDSLLSFLSKRILEQDEFHASSDSIRIKLPDGRIEKVIVEGTHPGGLIFCKNELGMGIHLVKISSVLKEDRGKLTEVLNELEIQGKVIASV